MQIPAQPQQQGHKKQRLWTLKLSLTCSMSTMETTRTMRKICSKLIFTSPPDSPDSHH